MFKTRLDTFGNTFGHFWNFENIFFENFRKLDPPRNTGHNFFSKKIALKHVWILLGTILGIFGILKKKKLKIFENSTLHGKPGMKFFRKNHPKTRLDTFGNTFGHFWNFEKKILKIFEDSTFHGKLGKSFSKNLPQNTFKTRLDTFGNDFVHFWNFEKKNFENFRKLDPPWKTGHEIFSKKSP